ncbi:hypothetical protein [Streptomyces sp. ATCC 21386]|uniref:hypothetical protein n=1 Tax=Streptomyces sp. ATCC 21386 TaxID=2699428 RepID=UPI001BFF3FF5|nr:hypothetical protein [Streptomyces sp. ATCC 21386]
MAADDQTARVRGLLQGATVRSVGRAADLCTVEFTGLQGEELRAHIQCPFRILQEGKVILGSRDMRYPQRGAGPDAFDHFETIYDARAAKLNGIIDQLRPTVTDVAFGAGGHLAVTWRPAFRIEAFPDCSGAVEAWRVFTRGGPHYGYPEGSL